MNARNRLPANTALALVVLALIVIVLWLFDWPEVFGSNDFAQNENNHQQAEAELAIDRKPKISTANLTDGEVVSREELTQRAEERAGFDQSPVVYGRYLDADGQGIADAQVEVWGRPPTGMGGRLRLPLGDHPDAISRTDSEGRFEIPLPFLAPTYGLKSLRRGEATADFIFRHPEFPDFRPDDLPPQGAEWLVKAKSFTFTLKGRVLLYDKSPANKAGISIGGKLHGWTNEAGTFSLSLSSRYSHPDWSPSSSYAESGIIRVRHTLGEASFEIPLPEVLSNTTSHDVGDITLLQGETLAGSCHLLNGVPLAGLMIRADSVDFEGPALRGRLHVATITGADGGFSFFGLEPGKYTIRDVANNAILKNRGVAISHSGDVHLLLESPARYCVISMDSETPSAPCWNSVGQQVETGVSGMSAERQKGNSKRYMSFRAIPRQFLIPLPSAGVKEATRVKWSLEVEGYHTLNLDVVVEPNEYWHEEKIGLEKMSGVGVMELSLQFPRAASSIDYDLQILQDGVPISIGAYYLFSGSGKKGDVREYRLHNLPAGDFQISIIRKGQDSIFPIPLLQPVGESICRIQKGKTTGFSMQLEAVVE